MKIRLTYTDGSTLTREFQTYLDLRDFCFLEGDHLLKHTMVFEVKDLGRYELDCIDPTEHPEFESAQIFRAWTRYGRELITEELEILNEDTVGIHEAVCASF